MKLIETRFKAKPSYGFTHSLGSKAISTILLGCQFYEALKIGFHDSIGNRIGLFTPHMSLQKIKGHSKDLLNYRCLISIRYSAPINEWNIILYSVSVDKNKVSKKFLQEKAIPIIRNWLDEDKPQTWFEGHRYLQIGLNDNITSYCVLETQNDHIIDKKTAIIS